MENKKYMFLFLLLFMFVFSLSAVSADDVNTTESGEVSGDVDVATTNPWDTSGELNYDIPSEAKEIKSAKVYVNVYSGSAKTDRGANANVTLKTNKSEEKIANEKLWIDEGSTNGTIYQVNNHTTKCYSDYQMYYDITENLKGLNGTSISIKVDTYEMENKTFDGRIKLIGLTLAYNDGDDDKINYWINGNQIWTNSNTTLTFDTTSLVDVLEASLTNIALSGSDGTYKINDEFLTDSKHESGNYYQYNKWDVTDYLKNGKETEFLAIGTPGTYGISYKNALSVLVAKSGEMKANVSLATERTNKGVTMVYAGTYNQITATVSTNKNGKYTLELLADGTLVNSTEISLKAGTTKIYLIDPTNREPKENTAYVVNGYDNVTYTINLKKDDFVNDSSLKAAILYNGYFAKDLSYPGNDFASFYNGTITGNIVIDVSNNTYASGNTNRSDTWNINLPDSSSFVKAWIYVPYSSISNDNENMFDIKFNNNSLTPIVFIRDQPNVISTTGYGLIVYDVTDLIKSKENILTLNRTLSGGIYSPTLIYLYNTTNSNIIKNIYISNGADLVGTYGNIAGRTIKVDTTLNIDSSNIQNAIAYIFGAGAKTGRASITINGEEDDNAWNTNVSDAINVYTKDISNTVKDTNNISIVLKDSMFTALQQIIVTSKNITKPEPQPEPKQNSTTNQTVNPTPSTAKVTKKATASKITAKNKTFKAKTKVKKYSVTLKSGKKAIKNVTVTIKIGKKTYKAKTNNKGKAVFKIKKLTKKGKYKAVIKFAGNKSYKASKKTVKITIKK